MTRIAFGSCVDASKPVYTFDAIIESKPDLTIFLGDNVYADTTDETELRAAYQQLADNEYFQRLIKATPVMATWDDHDYGINDGGAEHPTKAMAQRVILGFWKEPANSPRWKQEGIYDAKVFGPAGKRVQIILLDTRYHRGPLTRNDQKVPRGTGPYLPNLDPAISMLGTTQWNWLQKQLSMPAEIRLIVSSIQVISEDHNWESWSMMSTERAYLFQIIDQSQAQGVIFLSGDRHQAELSNLDAHYNSYPLYDLTASSFNKPGLENDEPNRHRIGKRYPFANFGLIQINWELPDPQITLSILDRQCRVQIEHTLLLSEVSPLR